jgi:hypothetical protein
MSLADHVEPPEFVRRLASHDAQLARYASFALVVQVYLEQMGLVPRRFVPEESRAPVALPPVDRLPEAVGHIVARNPHLLVVFADAGRRDALASLDQVAVRDLIGWVRGQHLDREEAQVAYELGLLALGAVVPSVYVRALRRVELHSESRVVELPDGAGYPTVFLSTLHPHWSAAGRTRFLVHAAEAEQLAAWALLLLSKDLVAPTDAIRRIPAEPQLPLDPLSYDVALIYNPIRALSEPPSWSQAVRAEQYVSV